MTSRNVNLGKWDGQCGIVTQAALSYPAPNLMQVNQPPFQRHEYHATSTTPYTTFVNRHMLIINALSVSSSPQLP